MKLNKSALFKSLIIAIIFTAILAFVFKNSLFHASTLRMSIGYFIVVFGFFAILVANYRRYVWEEKFNHYVKKFHLSPEELEKVTGRSKFEFFQMDDGEIKFPSKNAKVRLEILKSLEEKFGTELSEKNEN